MYLNSHHLKISDPTREIGSFFRKERKRQKLSQLEIVSRAKVSLATLQNFELGKGNPELKTLQALLNVLNLKLQISRKEISLASLIALGVPLIDVELDENVELRPDILWSTLNNYASYFLDLPKQGREFIAIISFLSALCDHFPSQWGAFIDRGLKELFYNHLSLIRPNLRRIALNCLAKYL